jgi:hypothetical protein
MAIDLVTCVVAFSSVEGSLGGKRVESVLTTPTSLKLKLFDKPSNGSKLLLMKSTPKYSASIRRVYNDHAEKLIAAAAHAAEELDNAIEKYGYAPQGRMFGCLQVVNKIEAFPPASITNPELLRVMNEKAVVLVNLVAAHFYNAYSAVKLLVNVPLIYQPILDDQLRLYILYRMYEMRIMDIFVDVELSECLLPTLELVAEQYESAWIRLRREAGDVVVKQMRLLIECRDAPLQQPMFKLPTEVKRPKWWVVRQPSPQA